MATEEPQSILTTVDVFDNPLRANLARALLESEGIAAYLFDEHTIALDPLLNTSLGGIKLKVNSAEHDKAVEILKRNTGEAGSDFMHCPVCNSSEVDTHVKTVRSFRALWAFVLSLATFTLPLHNDIICVCRSCGHTFKQLNNE
jgi:hypothetical protein